LSKKSRYTRRREKELEYRIVEEIEARRKVLRANIEATEAEHVERTVNYEMYMAVYKSTRSDNHKEQADALKARLDELEKQHAEFSKMLDELPAGDEIKIEAGSNGGAVPVN
jgi:hypothetical protein